jgi:hypothetical protein
LFRVIGYFEYETFNKNVVDVNKKRTNFFSVSTFICHAKYVVITNKNLWFKNNHFYYTNLLGFGYREKIDRSERFVLTANAVTWGQFHQCSTRSFCVRKFCAQLFCAYVLGLYFIGTRLLAQKLRIEC